MDKKGRMALPVLRADFGDAQPPSEARAPLAFHPSADEVAEMGSCTEFALLFEHIFIGLLQRQQCLLDFQAAGIADQRAV